jgi:hypothetical protein
MKDALDQPMDDDIRVRHADGDGESAHASLSVVELPEASAPLQIAFTMTAEW